MGDRAVRDAIVASGAIRASSEEDQAEAQAADENLVAAAELPHATGGPDIASVEKLPDTGGPSPLWLGAPLLCAGGLLAGRIFLP